MNSILKSIPTCPLCKEAKEESMPTDEAMLQVSVKQKNHALRDVVLYLM
ncbi:hypothetical protein ACXYMT_10125 [Salinimicrobium sp. CAU 1759]